MLKASSCKHGPAHFFILFLFESYRYLRKSQFLGFPCFCKPIKMAGAGYGVTPMSRLSQHSSRRRHRSPQTGKPLDLSSPNIAATPPRKKPPKRKTLSSRYTAELPSKRRKLGIDASSDPINLAGTAVSQEACHSTEVNRKERESKPLSTKGTARKARAKAKARIKANGVQGNLIAEASKVLDAKTITAHSPVGVSDSKAKLLTVNESIRAGHFHEGNHNGDLSPSSIGKVNSKARLLTLESNQVGPLLLDRLKDLQNQDTDRQAQASNWGPVRKSISKRFPNSSSELRTERDHDGAQLSGAASPSLLSESLLEDSLDGSPYSRQDSCLLEGRFLRPRRQARKKSKSDDHRLPPSEYVGKRVVVYWPHAKAWYAGKVIKYDDTTKKHKIKYDDGDEECISFRRHKVVLETSPSTQAADCPVLAKVAERASAAHHPVDKDVTTDAEPCESVQLQADFVEDNALLSAFAPRQRFREASREPLCNGSVKPVGAVKRVDSKDSPVQKASKTRMSSVAQENTERAGTEDNVHASGGACGGEAAFVYVRRTKGRQKVGVSLTDLAPSERVNDSDSLSGALQLERPRKRKKCQPLVQQTAQVDFLHGRYSDTNLNSPDAPVVRDENGGGGSASERSLRKRNKRSLKKLVSQVTVSQGTEVAQELEPRRDRKRKQASKRTGRKLVRKHKLTSLVLSARDRRLPTERVSHDAEGLMYASLCRDVVELHDSEVSALVLESHDSFYRTIHLVLPVVLPDLFTWQLFSVLARVNFCEGSSFDERFSLKGSLEDWKGIFRIASGIVKAVPLSAWMNGRQWQRIILHELWNVMPRCGPALTDVFAFLPAKAESIIVEHLRGAIFSCTMTSRQILNLFVHYFIKPYIVATVCEKGASFKVVVQQVLLLDRSKDAGTTCLRQSVKSFPLQLSSGSADSDFSSYLMLFPRSMDWCTEEGLFLKQMEGWIETAACAGYAEKWVPILTIKKSNHLGWQITSTHLVNHGYAIDGIESKVFKLEQGTAKLGMSNNFSVHCPRHAEWRLSGFDQNDGWSVGCHNCQCLNSALLFASFLQRSLFEAVDTGVCSSPTTKSLLLNKVPAEDKQSVRVARMKLIGIKEESELGSMAVPNSDVVTKHVKNEPDMIFSRRNSSITTESNGAAIKEESSVEMYGRQQTLGQLSNGFPSKSDEQHFSGQIDQEYYVHKRSKDMRKVKKSRPRHRSERRHSVREEPSTFCCADLLYTDGDVVVRERDARVEVQPNGKIDFLVAVHLDGTEVFARRVNQVSTLGMNPPELMWRSGNGWAIDFPDREQWELFRAIYNELCIRTVQGCTKEIPVPVVKGIESSDGSTVLSSSIRPFFAIKYPEGEIAVAYKTGRILYDLDSEDEAWMNEINRESGNDISDSSLVISDDALEQMIDRLEKEVYRRGDECVAVHDAVQVCQDLGVAGIVRAVHAYWSNKRLGKGKSLLRYFQPPLWEQYQDELRIWEARMEHCSPNAQNMLLERFPRPVMSAFCLQSRTLDALDTSKRMLRQRSQRKIRPPSRSSSEDSHRLSAYRHTDSAWHLTNHSQYGMPSTHFAIGLQPHALHDRFHKQEEEEESEEVKAARATAVEARKLATVRATKLQRRFLEFDSLLQRAWALLIEYEAVAGDEASAQSETLEGRMTLLFSRCSSLLSKGDDSNEDEPPSHSGRACKDVGQEFLEAFARKCSLNGKVVVCERVGDLDLGGDCAVEEASPLLPISVKASSYAWNGSSLL